MTKSDINTNRAEVVALDVLRYLASDTERFERFLSYSGLAVGDIASQAEKPEFLASVVDYLLAHEGLLKDFAQGAGLQPRFVENLRLQLPGADRP